ncbi:MAG TPA: glycosyltransferase [Solirubrobacterales bacterium]|nr:glycosyltransferase [Solirubrobacterales bacterium]
MIELPAAKDPAVSVIVLLDGAVEMAERCLTALAACDEDVPFEVIVLLNDPSPGLESFVRRSTRGGRVVLCRGNAGPGVGWNLGAAVARAPRLASLHEDSEPEPGWLAPLVETMTETGAGAVGARLFNGDGAVQNCGWVLFADASHQPITAASAPEVVAATEPTPADMLSGAAMVVDREAVRTVGGWDERFHPAVFVDIDVSTALWNHGKPVLSVPASRVRHQSHAFDRRGDSPLTGPRLRTVLFERNSVPFLEKWGPFVSERAAPPDHTDPASVRPAVAAALTLTRERAARVAAGGWRPPRPGARAEARFSGLAEPPVAEAGDGSFRVAPAVEAALAAAEAELVRHYCLWLVRKEEMEFGRLLEAHEELQRREREFLEQRAAGEQAAREHDEVARRLNAILAGRTWRLRTAAMRLLGRG